MLCGRTGQGLPGLPGLVPMLSQRIGNLKLLEVEEAGEERN